MSLTYLVDRRIAGPHPTEIITVSLGGRTFRAGKRTAAHLEATIAAHPDLQVIQPCYNTGVAASAGTHDGDGVVDVRIPSMSWAAAQSALRRLGWAAWWRHTGEWADESRWHIHMVSLGCPGPVGIYVPGQVADYYAHRTGLVGHSADPSWHPADIDSTVFDYPAYLASEDDMAYTDWPQKDRDALLADLTKGLVPAIVSALLQATVDNARHTVRGALRKAAGLGGGK